MRALILFLALIGSAQAATARYALVLTAPMVIHQDDGSTTTLLKGAVYAVFMWDGISAYDAPCPCQPVQSETLKVGDKAS